MVFWVDEWVAISPMPSRYNLDFVINNFGAVIILVDPYDLEYDPELLKSKGLRILHKPIAELSAPSLIELHEIVDFIVNCIDEGRRVLIHCLAGYGRSGTVAAGYLAFKYKLTGDEAISRVRDARPGAIESFSQEAVVRAYAILVKLLEPHEIKAVFNVGEQVNWGRGHRHASAVAQIALRLWDQLRSELGLGIFEGKALAIASLLHDIGVTMDSNGHHEKTYEMIIRSSELKALGEELTRLAALTALHHRAKTNPFEDPRTKGYEHVVAKLASLLRIADALDFRSMQVVEDVDVEITSNEIKLSIYSIDICNEEVERAMDRAKLLEEITCKKIVIT